MKIKTINLMFFLLLTMSGALRATEIVHKNITEDEVRAAQDAWGQSLIQISDDYQRRGIEKATETASTIIDNAYGYIDSPVLFKPTLASGEQTFRTTKQGALSYFVGHNNVYPHDSGFALKNWKKYRYDNAAIYIDGNLALTMGKVYLIDRDNKETIVDKSWGFRKGDDGKVRIVLHHSSIPYHVTK